MQKEHTSTSVDVQPRWPRRRLVAACCTRLSIGVGAYGGGEDHWPGREKVRTKPTNKVWFGQWPDHSTAAGFPRRDERGLRPRWSLAASAKQTTALPARARHQDRCTEATAHGTAVADHGSEPTGWARPVSRLDTTRLFR